MGYEPLYTFFDGVTAGVKDDARKRTVYTRGLRMWASRIYIFPLYMGGIIYFGEYTTTVLINISRTHVPPIHA